MFEEGLKEMSRFLGAREGADAQDSSAMGNRVVSYLTTMFHAKNAPDKVGIRTTRETRMLAEALGALKAGQLPEVADLPIQKSKSLEVGAPSGAWDVAQRLELIPEMDLGFASAQEVRAAQRASVFHDKVKGKASAK